MDYSPPTNTFGRPPCPSPDWPPRPPPPLRLPQQPPAARCADDDLLELDVLWSSSTSASPAIGLGILAALPEDEGKKKKHVAVRALREVEEGVD